MTAQQQPPPATEASPSRPPTPAEEALAREGGPIIPDDFVPPRADFESLRPVVERLAPAPAAAPDGPTKHVVDLSRGVLHGGAPPPGTPAELPPSPEQLAFEAALRGEVNFETNIFSAVYGAVRNMVAYWGQITPVDSAEAGQAMFGPGVRTPLEQAEPQIAVEVYRQVRENMRADARAARRPGWLRRLLGLG